MATPRRHRRSGGSCPAEASYPPAAETAPQLLHPLRGGQPNERWQADITHWKVAGGKDVEILNVIDDHSRLLVASHARAITKAADVVETFHRAAAAHGLPASMLTDNGAVFTAAPRGGGRCAIEIELARLGIAYRHSSPYHPQTCGKVERFHQTLKRWLAKQTRGR